MAILLQECATQQILLTDTLMGLGFCACSRIHLLVKSCNSLRNALKKELFSNYNAFAAGASTIVHVQTPPASLLEKRPKPPPFRPLIRLGRFPTVSLANRALQRL